MTNCRSVLTDLEQLLSKYQTLGKLDGSRAKPWDKLRFGNKDLSSVREKLVVHTNALSLFLQTLGTGSLGRIERVLDHLVQEVRAGKRETTTIIIFGEHNEPQDVHWNSVEKAMHGEGIPKKELELHRNGIRAYLQEQVEKFHLPAQGNLNETLHTRRGQDLQEVPTKGKASTEIVRTNSLEGSRRVPSSVLHSSSSLSLSSAVLGTEKNNNGGAREEASTDVQEYDSKGQLRKRTISYSSVSSARSNAHSSAFTNNGGRSSFSSIRSPFQTSWEALPNPDVPVPGTLALTIDAGSSRVSMDMDDTSGLAGERREQGVDATANSRTRRKETSIKASERIKELEAKVQELTERSENQEKDMDMLTFVVSSLKSRLDDLTAPVRSRQSEPQDRNQPQGTTDEPEQETSVANLESRMHSLTLARDYYRKERNFFKDVALRFGWLDPGRPPSPPEI